MSTTKNVIMKQFNGTDYDILHPETILPYVTTAPTSNNTERIKIAVLPNNPTTKYAGWLYIITEE